MSMVLMSFRNQGGGWGNSIATFDHTKNGYKDDRRFLFYAYLKTLRLPLIQN